MLPSAVQQCSGFDDYFDDDLFRRITEDIQRRGYSIQPAALPPALVQQLLDHVQQMSPQQFVRAGIGRQQDYMQNTFVRTDEICWINGESEAGASWLRWAGALQQYLNRRLFLGLFSFESHFAHYAVGDYYKRHTDAFKGEANRILSLVVYLNPGWSSENGGELVLYRDEYDGDGIRVQPSMASVVVFLSEEFPHEVLPATRDRYSIAGWFRVNTSQAKRVDPPR